MARHRTNNGLQLDFTIESNIERQKYVNNLVLEWEKLGKKLREEDLDLLADYVLYGKDSDGKSPVDKKEIEIQSKYSIKPKKQVKSLEELMESPSFDENQINSINKKIIYKTPKVKFSREENKDIEYLNLLWKDIDRIAAKIEYFTNKKQLNDFSQDIQEYLIKCKKPNQYDIYKLKHLLIEKRREQFTIRDYYHPLIQNIIPHGIYVGDEGSSSIDWQSNQYPIYPLGLLNGEDYNFILYLEKDSFLSKTKEELEKIPNYIPEDSISSKNFLDFRNMDHIYNLLKFYEELETSCLDNPESTVRAILNTLNFYIKIADLSEEQQDILQLKIQKYSNDFIQKYINEKYSKNHTANYISTIFKKTICENIAEAATLHYDTFKNRFNKNSFKRCNCCGRIKLRDTRNFVRKARSSDGLSNRCKKCDKNDREKLKRNNNDK